MARGPDSQCDGGEVISVECRMLRFAQHDKWGALEVEGGFSFREVEA